MRLRLSDTAECQNTGMVPRLLEMQDEVELVGVYDILPEKQQQLIEEHQGKIHAYRTFEELLQDKRVELAIVAIPNDAHLPVCCALMEHKNNVICEKPVALNSEELEQMIRCSE